MAKHMMLPCHKCGKPESRTRISAVYGCRECKAAMSDLDKQRAMLAHNVEHGKRLARLALEQKNAEERARRAAFAKELLEGTSEPSDDPLKQERAARALQRHKSREDAAMTPDRVAEIDARLLEAASRHEAFARVASAMQAVVPPMKRCACCDAPEPAGVVYEETFDGKVWCRMCAYGILRTGHCTPHNSTHYLDIAANTRSLSILQYPLDVLHPFTREFFMRDNQTTEIDP